MQPIHNTTALQVIAPVHNSVVETVAPTRSLLPARLPTAASPYISHYLCMIGQICDESCLLFCRRGTPWRLETRECLNDIWLRKSRSGLGGPGGDAAWVTRCGGVCQAGEARALAAAARRLAAQPQ